MVKKQHYVTFKIITAGDVPVSEDMNWNHFFKQMREWDVSMIRFEKGVNIPANKSTKSA